MNLNIRNWRLIPGLLCMMALATSPVEAKDDDERSGGGKIVGTWFTIVTARVCQTGAVLRTFPALNTFNTGETLVDTTTAFGPAVRSPGMGKWEKSGPRSFVATSAAFLFNPAGAWTGTQKLTHRIELRANELEFTSTFEIIDTAGAVTSSGCATAVGSRL